jgi:signal peptidase I
LPTVPEAFASLLRTIVVALFLLTFLLQPYLIPSESMEHTLLVGDFVLVNKQVYAPAGRVSRWLMPYHQVARGDIVVFHHAQPPFLVKRVVGIPGDRLRIQDGRVTVNGQTLDEPYVAFEPTAYNPFGEDFPAKVYTDAEPHTRRRIGGSSGRVLCVG